MVILLLLSIAGLFASASGRYIRGILLVGYEWGFYPNSRQLESV
jgi:hypothetical protein